MSEYVDPLTGAVSSDVPKEIVRYRSIKKRSSSIWAVACVISALLGFVLGRIL